MTLTKKQPEAYEAAVSTNGLQARPGSTFEHREDGMTIVRDAEGNPIMWLPTDVALEIAGWQNLSRTNRTSES